MIKIKVITGIEPQKKRKNRYNIYINNEFAFGVDEDVIIKCSLKEGKVLTDDYIENIIKAEECAKAMNYAVLVLGYRQRSVHELKTKMLEKGYEMSIIDDIIDKMKHYRFLNDIEFAKSLIKDKQEFKKAGKNLLRQELYQKGIDREIINQLLEENVDEEEEYERALALAIKKNNTLKNDDYNAKYRKISGLLGRKGYSFDIISRVMREVLNK